MVLELHEIEEGSHRPSLDGVRPIRKCLGSAPIPGDGRHWAAGGLPAILARLRSGPGPARVGRRPEQPGQLPGRSQLLPREDDPDLHRLLADADPLFRLRTVAGKQLGRPGRASEEHFRLRRVVPEGAGAGGVHHQIAGEVLRDLSELTAFARDRRLRDGWQFQDPLSGARDPERVPRQVLDRPGQPDDDGRRPRPRLGQEAEQA